MKARIKQTGFVSIIVASLLMIILALITVGFTRLMQREQRQAIDRQLSAQALYAAEAGVNDVAAAITAGTPGYITSPKIDCDPSALPSSDLSGDGTIAVTCALFNEEPGSLSYDIGTDNSKIVELRSASTNNFNSINVAWGREGITNPLDNDIGSLESCASTLASISEYPATRPGVVPILKFDLSSVVGGNYDRGSLLQNTDYIYFVPCDGAGAGSYTFDIASRGNVFPVPCSGTDLQPCSVDIIGLAPPLPYASNAFFARIRPVYENAAVSVTGTEDTGAGVVPAQFAGAQVGIDVTARSGDVVRRLRASVPLSTSGDVPEFALQAFEGICKRLDVINGVVPGAVINDNCDPLPPATITVCNPVGPGTIVILQSVYDADPSLWTTPPCGGPVVCASNQNFSLGDYAATLPDPDDRRYALDVAYWDPIATAFNHHPISSPHIPLDSLGIVVDPDPTCTYEIDFTAFCTFVDPDPLINPPPRFPPADCSNGGFNQELESARLEFYGAYTGAGGTLTCDLTTLIGYADAPDNPDAIGGFPAVLEWSGVAPVVRVSSGPVRCLRIVHMCVANPASLPGCSSAVDPLRQGSVHYENIIWRGF